MDHFKAAAAEGAVLELKLRLLAGTVSGLKKYAHEQNLGNIEDGLATHFGDTLSAAEKEMLRVCRHLRNKVLHSDFRAARSKLDELGVATKPDGVVKIDLPVPTIAELSKKLESAKAGTEGQAAHMLSMKEAGVYGWFLEAGCAGDFEKAFDAFKTAAKIVDRLAGGVQELILGFGAEICITAKARPLDQSPC